MLAGEANWYVGPPGHWPRPIVTRDATVYLVDQSHNRRTVFDLPGDHFTDIQIGVSPASYVGLPGWMHRCIARYRRAIAAT